MHRGILRDALKTIWLDHAERGRVPGPLGVLICAGCPMGLNVRRWGSSWFHSMLPLVPEIRKPREFSTPRGSLCNPETASCAVFHSEQGSGKVMDLPAGNDGSGLGGHFGHIESRYKTDEVVGMGSYISHNKGGAHPFSCQNARGHRLPLDRG